ncbi:hypothetical protein OHA40_15115 [Nocardia sp. NBC_00508]|uniref:hypothetical protein n=1 Tax=Nocardia sp. NBC_00508 TaxID=2975992 RepID=UPI002E8139D6|nr:hypothetical protein [Nocardia sp. NBC_00508]WUD69334.1 hypothetical protein OHA40_15115 [Nocardia sp. NBC_00508]
MPAVRPRGIPPGRVPQHGRMDDIRAANGRPQGGELIQLAARRASRSCCAERGFATI